MTDYNAQMLCIQVSKLIQKSLSVRELTTGGGKLFYNLITEGKYENLLESILVERWI